MPLDPHLVDAMEVVVRWILEVDDPYYVEVLPAVSVDFYLDSVAYQIV